MWDGPLKRDLVELKRSIEDCPVLSDDEKDLLRARDNVFDINLF